MANCPKCGGNMSRIGEEYVCELCGSKFKKKSKSKNPSKATQPIAKDKISPKNELKNKLKGLKIENRANIETVPALLLCLIPCFISVIMLVSMYIVTKDVEGTYSGPWENVGIYSMIGPIITFVIFCIMFGLGKYILAVESAIVVFIWKLTINLSMYSLYIPLPPVNIILALMILFTGFFSTIIFLVVSITALPVFAGVVSILVLGTATIILIFKQVPQKRLGKAYYLWIIPLLITVLFTSIMAGVLLQDEYSRSRHKAKHKVEQQDNSKEMQIPISISDIDIQTINHANTYAQNDLSAKIAGAQDGSMDGIMQKVTKTPGMDKYDYSWKYDYVTVHNSSITPISYSLFIPNSTSKSATRKGLLKINYKVSLSMGWGFIGDTAKARNSMGKTSDYTFDNVFYISYIWDVDTLNKDVPIADFAKYKCDIDKADCDYTNWYNRNIIALQDKYIIDEIESH